MFTFSNRAAAAEYKAETLPLLTRTIRANHGYFAKFRAIGRAGGGWDVEAVTRGGEAVPFGVIEAAS